MSQLRLHLSRSGRPLANCQLAIGDSGELRTDARGAVAVQLSPGRHSGWLFLDEQRLDFEFVAAPGLRELQVDLHDEEDVLDDPAVLAQLPSERYRPLRELGRGGMGVVFKCRDAVLGRVVAVKMLHPELVAKQDAAEAFLREGRALAALEHPNLIPVYDLGWQDGKAWLVTRFIDGPNLEERLVDSGPMSWSALAAAGRQVASALAKLHASGLVHQDVKPSNAFVDRDGAVFLGDFGLVQSIEQTHVDRETVAGTPAYMSPELCQGRPLGPASDVYALGASLFQLAAGRVPFDGEPMQQLMAHVGQPAPDLRHFRPDAPLAWAELLRSMLAKEPGERPAAQQVEQALAQLEQEATTVEQAPYVPRPAGRTGAMPVVSAPTRVHIATVEPGPRPQPEGRRGLWGPAVLGAALLGAGLWFALAGPGAGSGAGPAPSAGGSEPDGGEAAGSLGAERGSERDPSGSDGVGQDSSVGSKPRPGGSAGGEPPNERSTQPVAEPRGGDRGQAGGGTQAAVGEPRTSAPANEASTAGMAAEPRARPSVASTGDGGGSRAAQDGQGSQGTASKAPELQAEQAVASPSALEAERSSPSSEQRPAELSTEAAEGEPEAPTEDDEPNAGSAVPSEASGEEPAATSGGASPSEPESTPQQVVPAPEPEPTPEAEAEGKRRKKRGPAPPMSF